MAVNAISPNAWQVTGDPMWENLIPAIQRGLQLGFAIPQNKADLQQKQLANALTQVNLQTQPQMNQADLSLKQAQGNLAGQQAQYYPQVTGSEIDLRKAQTQEALAQAIASMNKPNMPASDIGKLQYDYQSAIKTYGENSPQAKQIEDQIDKQNTVGGMVNKSFSYPQAMKDASEQAAHAVNLLNNANAFDNAYNKSSYTGSLLGNVPSKGIGGSFSDSATQEADNAAQNMVATMLSMQGGKFTNYGLRFISSTKPDRQLNSDAKDAVVNKLKAVAMRTQERLPFLNYAVKNGVSLQDADNLWNQYEQNYPVIDPATGKSNPIKSKNKQGKEIVTSYENLGKWQDVIDQYKKTNMSANEPLTFNPTPEQTKALVNSGQATIANPNSIAIVKAPNGKILSGTPEQVAQAMKDNPSLVRIK